MSDEIETIVVGGGPAGAATACGLAAAGREVMLIERAGGPHHKVCGEFLGIDTQVALHRLGIDPRSLGAVAIEHVVIRAARRSLNAALPFRAVSLSRYRLDEALLRRAADQGAALARNTLVREIARAEQGWRVRCAGGEAYRCRHLVFATGKWPLRGITDARDASFIGLKMHLRLTAAATRALDGAVELAPFARGYAGLEPVEDGIANLCLVLPSEVVARIGPGWPALRAHLELALPQLCARLAGSTPLWDKPLAVVCPAGSHLHRGEGDSVFRVGDRLAHIPPFAGDGLAIALASAALAADHIRRGVPPQAYHAAVRGMVGPSLRLAGMVAGLAQSRVGGPLLMAAATAAPALIGAIARQTRLPRLPMPH
jgi:flavin-dependent dehydrogenase